METIVSYLKIADELNLQKDDVLLLASDITKLAYTTIRNKERFDEHAFLSSFREKLSDGTLFIPGFMEHFKAGNCYSRIDSKPEMGALSNAAFRSSHFTRSLDPLHSFFIAGKNAEELANKKNYSTFGEHSLFAFLKNAKAKMVLIDVDLQHSFTFAHYAEENQQVNYRKYSNIVYSFIDESGVYSPEKLQVYSKKKGIQNSLNRLESIFLQGNAMEIKTINGSIFRIIDLEKAFDLMIRDIQTNKARNLYQFNIKLYLRSCIKSLLKK